MFGVVFTMLYESAVVSCPTAYTRTKTRSRPVRDSDSEVRPAATALDRAGWRGVRGIDGGTGVAVVGTSVTRAARHAARRCRTMSFVHHTARNTARRIVCGAPTAEHRRADSDLCGRPDREPPVFGTQGDDIANVPIHARHDREPQRLVPRRERDDRLRPVREQRLAARSRQRDAHPHGLTRRVAEGERDLDMPGGDGDALLEQRDAIEELRRRFVDDAELLGRLHGVEVGRQRDEQRPLAPDDAGSLGPTRLRNESSAARAWS